MVKRDTNTNYRSLSVSFFDFCLPVKHQANFTLFLPACQCLSASFCSVPDCFFLTNYFLYMRIACHFDLQEDYSYPASGPVEFKRRQMKQCWKSYINLDLTRCMYWKKHLLSVFRTVCCSAVSNVPSSSFSAICLPVSVCWFAEQPPPNKQI